MRIETKKDLTINAKLNGIVINITLLSILFIAFFFRLWKLESYFYFAEETNNVLYTIQDFVNGKHSLLLGLEATGYLHHLFHTPWYLYLMAPLFLLAKGEPLVFAAFHSIIGIIAVFFLYKIGEKLGDRKMGYIASAIYAVSFSRILVDRSVWAVGLIPFSTILAVYLLVISIKDKRNFYYLLLGIWAGIALSFHYQFFVVITAVIILIFLKNKNKLILILIPIGISLLPLLIFDLRHNFFNVYGFYLWFKVTLEGGSPYTYRNYLFFSYPVLILASSYLLAKIKRKFLSLLFIYFLIQSKVFLSQTPPPPGSYLERNKLINKILDNYQNGLEVFFKDEDSYRYRYLLFLRAKQRNYDMGKIKIYEPWQPENSAHIVVESSRLFKYE